MRIAHVIHCLDPRSGGPPEALWNLAAEQTRAGHEVTIVSTDVQAGEEWMDSRSFERSLRRRAASHHIALHLLEGWGRTGIWRRYRYIPGIRRHLEAILPVDCNGRFIIHIHGLFSHLTESACAHCLRHQIPYILRPAGGLNRQSLLSGSRTLKQLFIQRQTGRHVNGATLLHMTSQREQEETYPLFPDARYTVVPHGVRIPTTSALERWRAEFFKSNPWIAGRRVVLFLSRLAPKKRLELLLEAFKEEGLANRGWVLVVAGEGPERHRLMKLYDPSSGIVFTGFLAGPAKHRVLAAADVFCLPSLDENFGLAVAEAMAHRCAVVTTDAVDSSIHVRTSDGGLVCGTPADDFRSSLLRVLSADFASMGTRARHHARRHLGWKAVQQQLEQRYQECLFDG